MRGGGWNPNSRAKTSLGCSVALSGSAACARHAASPSGPPSRTAAAADDGSEQRQLRERLRRLRRRRRRRRLRRRAAARERHRAARSRRSALQRSAPRGGAKAFGSTITKAMPRHVRVSFPDVDGTSSTYDAKRQARVPARRRRLTAAACSPARALVHAVPPALRDCARRSAPLPPSPCGLCSSFVCAGSSRPRAPARLGSPAPLPSLSRRGGQVQFG